MQTLPIHLLPSTLRQLLALWILAWAWIATANAQPAALASEAAAAMTQEPPRLSSGTLPVTGADAQGNSQVWQHAIWWQRHGAADLGWGVAYRQAANLNTAATPAPLAAPSTAPTNAMALVAVGRTLTPSLSVHVGAALPLGITNAATNSWRDAAADTTPPDNRGELRMGLSFQARSAASHLRQGLALRVELSGSTALTLKPRAGRVGLQLNSQW